MDVATASDFRARMEGSITELPSGLAVRARYAGSRTLLYTGKLRAYFDAEMEAMGAMTSAREAVAAEEDEAGRLRAMMAGITLQKEARIQQQEMLLDAILVEPAYAEIKDVLDDRDASRLLELFAGLSPEEASELDFTSGA
jgi:endonuclease/exonuclease/phosphatase family metal-dependent hydrolase